MKKVVDICSMQSSQEIGKLKLIRFFFDNTSQKCFPFIFKGISSNQNRFNTEEECTAVCTGRHTEVHKEPMYIKKFIYLKYLVFLI